MEEIEKKIKKEQKYIPPIIPAYKIVDAVKGSGFIQDYVNEILPVIEDDIQVTINSPEKKNYSITEIPTMFNVPGMSNARAQKYVYFHLLRALKKSKYIPKIDIRGTDPKSQKVFIYVSWFSKEDIEMEKYMNKFIQAHSLNYNPDYKPEQEQPRPIHRRRRKQD